MQLWHWGRSKTCDWFELATKKLTIFADVEIKGNMKYSGGGGSGDVRVGNSGTECTPANAGTIRYVPKKGLTFCDGKAFHYLKSLGGEWITGAGNLFSQLKIGQGESFARDDVSYCVNCVDPNYIAKSTDFRIGGGDAPFNYYGSCLSNKCEISGDAHGNIHLAGTNGNDAIRMKLALLKGDFEYGCSVTKGTSGHNRFGMGLWGTNAVSKFKSGNSAGYCAQASSGNCYFCRFEGASCAFRGSYSAVFSLPNIHDENTEFKFVRKAGQICGYTKGVKRGCYSQKYTGDMYGAVQNDGGSSRNLHRCFYRNLGKTPSKGNYQFATVKARNADKTPMQSYTVASGKLPPGMKLDKKSGMIYGNPTDVSKAQKYSFAVQADGKEGATLKRGFTIEVRHRQTVDKRSTDFSQGSGKAFKYVGSCNGKCEIASDSAGNVKLSGSNGNDAIIMNKPLLVGDFEYGCTITSGSGTHNRFGMGIWDEIGYSQFKSSNSNGNCYYAAHGTCYFCRFEASRCAFKGTHDATFGLPAAIHSANARFMLKRVNGEICGYVNDKKSGCFTQKTTRPLYGAIQNDGGASRNMHKCYYKTSSAKASYK